MSNLTAPTPNYNRTLSRFEGLFQNISDLKSGEVRVSLNLFPFLSDHAFQDMVVLPGSVYAEMAIALYSKYVHRVPNLIENINFGSLIILSDDETILGFEISDISKTRKRIEFFQRNDDSGNRFFSTTFELDDTDQFEGNSDQKMNDFDEIRFNAASLIQSEEFYSKLWSNGNQYGPYFKNIKQVWINRNEILGELDFSGIEDLSGTNFLLNPLKVDSFTQLFSLLSRETDKTFILSSISGIRIHNADLPGHMWCYGRLLTPENGNNDPEGELKVYGDDGTLYLEISGVKFKYLEKPQQKESFGKICIASTFTAEPVEDSLKFWNNFFDFSFDIRFAPYNQVFQELLNPQSMLAANKKGVNIILLGLEDWTRREHKLIPLVSRDDLDALFMNKSRYTLPNQLEIVQLNKYETEYVYKEIFVDKCYLKHGITINDGDTIIDIGANIGLFTLFVNQYCKDPVVYSFEPSPVVYDLLAANSRVYGQRVKTFNYGVSDKDKTAVFTFYENSSVFSSFDPDEAEDQEAIQAIIRNLLRDSSGGENGSLDEYVSEMTNGRMKSKEYECRLLSVSDIIRENNIGKIDLLKIDAEKSELNIIRGIGNEDWEIIRQIVIEIHDKSGKVLKEIEGILKSKGFSCVVEEEEMLKGSGLYNIFARRDSLPEEQIANNIIKQKEEKLIENINNFFDSLSSFIQKVPVPLVVMVTPVSPAVLSVPLLRSLYEKHEGKLLERVNKLPNVYTIGSASLTSTYSAEKYYDLQGDELGHIPYTLPFFASIGTALYRLILSVQSSPRKVIAVDCDNTLWKGVCGEDGINGIQITEPYRVFQQFLIDQINSGMLVCLCSKNNEEDVMEIFRHRNDMLLKTGHLVSWRTNWDQKSANLLSLSEELNLSLDSFIFIDDNPVECAEVKASHPEVLTLQLPAIEEDIPLFLKNTWVFDNKKITEEDKKRTNFYKENLRREEYRSRSLTLKDFLEGLNLNLKISRPTEDQITRVSQLTFRTNQFNFTTIRRNEQEVREFLSKETNNCLIAEVSDRFGDYGLVGVLFYTNETNSYKVDTFLLSCRVLGRGVEFRVLSELGKEADEKGIEYIELRYIPSPKNKPASDFLKKTGFQFLKRNNKDEMTAEFPSEYLRDFNYASFIEQDTSYREDDKKGGEFIKSGVKDIIRYTDLSEKLQKIADDFKDAESIYRNIEEFKLRDESERKNIIKPETDLEKEMSSIWQKVLSRTNISIDDNFFEAGGDSLKAVQLVANVKQELDINISIVDVFECPTIQLLTQKFRLKTDNGKIGLNSEPGQERGSRRRNLRISRKNRNK
jgi:FkbH-like protein/FkbM family methyltransferase